MRQLPKTYWVVLERHRQWVIPEKTNHRLSSSGRNGIPVTCCNLNLDYRL